MAIGFKYQFPDLGDRPYAAAAGSPQHWAAMVDETLARCDAG
jgi:hypothetical protein